MDPQRGHQGEPSYHNPGRMAAPPGPMNSAPMYTQGQPRGQFQNQNWEWGGDDWGWSTPKATKPEAPQELQTAVVPSSSQGLLLDHPLGIESNFNMMSLANQNREEAPMIMEQQLWSNVQLPPSAAADDPASFSRVSTWGSALEHGAEHSLINAGSETNFYRAELGERNTHADGASFSDTSQPPQQMPLDQMLPPSKGELLGVSQPPTNLARTNPPPLNFNQVESIPLQRQSRPPMSDAQQREPAMELPLVESNPIPYEIVPPQQSLPQPLHVAKTNLPPPIGGFSLVDGYQESSSSSNHQFGNLDYQNQALPQTSVPSNNINTARYPDSISRSQSGTPSMEREIERPDAEGGYENDQPAANYQPLSQVGYVLPERKVAQESPAGSRPSSRQAVITPSAENPIANPPSYQIQGDVTSFTRPKATPPTGFYASTNPPMGPLQVQPIPATPPVARGPQEAVGSENGPPTSKPDGSNAPPTVFPSSSQRMIPGSGSHVSTQPMIVQQQLIQHPSLPQQQQTRPPGAITPVGEERIVTGFAKNDPVPLQPAAPAQTPIAPGPVPVSSTLQPIEEARSQSGNRSPPPPHRSETIGSENPRANMALPVNMPHGNAAVADRSDDRISLDRQQDRDRLEARNHDRGTDRREEHSRMDRERQRERDHDRERERASDRDREGDRVRDRDRDRDRNRDDYERDRTGTDYSRYKDDEDERYSYHDRRYDDRERDSRRYGERDRGYSRDYDEDRRSGYGPSDRDRMRDQRRRDPRRSDYYLTEAEMYERSGGRRSSLYEGETNDLAGDYNRSAYGFNTSRDGRRRDTDRSRVDDPFYQGPRDRPGTEMSERDYRMAAQSHRRDPRDMYYPDSRNYYAYGRSAAYNPYAGVYGLASAAPYYSQYSDYFEAFTRAFKENPLHLEQLRNQHPHAYAEWYHRYITSKRYPPSLTAGTATGVGSIAASEADRASVHSGRSSVAADHPSMIANLSLQQTMRGSTTGLDQTHQYGEFPSYQEDADPGLSIISTVQDITKMKFPCAHSVSGFSGNGALLRVSSIIPNAVELHDVIALLDDLPEAQELRLFPGPLVVGQTHKQVVMDFCQKKIRRATDEYVQLVDRQSYILLWELLLLLLHQNGTTQKTDIPELLLKNHEVLKEPVVQEAPEYSETETVVADRMLVSRHTEVSVEHKFRELAFFGRFDQALDWAMTQGLWGHAFALASNMGQRTFSSVMMRFNNSLAMADPLQTLFQHLSGRLPTAVTSCGDDKWRNDKWGDWRPHLAMLLSCPRTQDKSAELEKKSIVTLGDTLAARGYPFAAQFCYLVAQVEFGTYTNKTSKLVLLTSSTSLPFNAFASNEAIQCTEVYEYARQLACPDFVIQPFQPYKFLYATRLAELGRSVEALQYCEVIGNVMSRSPANFPVGFMKQVCEMGSMLRYSDPQYQIGDSLVELAWLSSLESAISSSTGTPITEETSVLGQTQNHESEPQHTPEQQHDYGSELQQQQQPFFVPSSNTQEQQQSFYNPNTGMTQPQSEQYGEESIMPQSANEQDTSIDYAQNGNQDYGFYPQNQFNNSWQQPAQQQQQTQQQQSPWQYNETTPTTNGNNYSDYWRQQSNNLITSVKNGGMRSTVSARDTRELHSEDEDEEDDESLGLENGHSYEPASSSVSGVTSYHGPRNRHVVFGGTFPIDRPLMRESGRHSMRRPTSLLTIKPPRTFSIDEPIRETSLGEGLIPNEEGSGMNSLSRSDYNQSPQSSGMLTPSTKPEEPKSSSEENDKATDATNQKSGGWFSLPFLKRSAKTEKKPTPMKLGDKMSFVYDKEKQRWVDTTNPDDESSQSLPPPPPSAEPSFKSLPSIPSISSIPHQMPTAGEMPSGPSSLREPPSSGQNRFRLNGPAVKRYATVENISIAKTPASMLPPDPLFGAAALTPGMPFYTPPPVDQSGPSEFTSPSDATAMTGQQQQHQSDPLAFNPALMPPPARPPGRPGLGSRGLGYPR